MPEVATGVASQVRVQVVVEPVVAVRVILPPTVLQEQQVPEVAVAVAFPPQLDPIQEPVDKVVAVLLF
jgi:hypothetical protein